MQDKITFSSDGFRLKGILHMPAADNPPVVVGCHGLYSNKNSPKQVELARRCNLEGIAFFRFDHRGCGESEGDFPKVTSLKARRRDLKSALKWIQSKKETGDRIGLFGSSMGGATCLAVASTQPVHAIVTVAAPLRSQTISRQAAQPDPGSPSLDWSDPSKYAFDISAGLSGIHTILIFHGDADSVVPPKNAQELYETASPPKRLLIQENGDHPMSLPHHQKIFMQETVAWFKTHLMA
jgi:alpha-beta hydrolase superfamily lysophospholipase